MKKLKFILIKYGISKFSSYLDYLENQYTDILDNPNIPNEEFLYFDRERGHLYVVRGLIRSYLTDLKLGFKFK